jgi:hypothetical protein
VLGGARRHLPAQLDSGSIFHAWVDYNGVTDSLEVRLALNDTRPAAALMSYTVDLVSVLGTTNAFVGFTSGTGAATADHDIRRWVFNSEFPGGRPDQSGRRQRARTRHPGPDAERSRLVGGASFARLSQPRLNRPAALRPPFFMAGGFVEAHELGGEAGLAGGEEALEIPLAGAQPAAYSGLKT